MTKDYVNPAPMAFRVPMAKPDNFEENVAKGGYKADEDKLPFHLLPADAVEEVVKVLQYGAKKYAPRNWERGMDWSRPFSAMMRHMWAWWRGEENDHETGLSHLAHAGCCILFLLAYSLRKIGNDDRPWRPL
jgi:hypothetical protein